MFESHADFLGIDLFNVYSLPFLKDIVKKVKKHVNVPLIIFAKGAHYAIPGKIY